MLLKVALARNDPGHEIVSFEGGGPPVHFDVNLNVRHPE